LKLGPRVARSAIFTGISEVWHDGRADLLVAVRKSHLRPKEIGGAIATTAVPLFGRLERESRLVAATSPRLRGVLAALRRAK